VPRNVCVTDGKECVVSLVKTKYLVNYPKKVFSKLPISLSVHTRESLSSFSGPTDSLTRVLDFKHKYKMISRLS